MIRTSFTVCFVAFDTDRRFLSFDSQSFAFSSILHYILYSRYAALCVFSSRQSKISLAWILINREIDFPLRDLYPVSSVRLNSIRQKFVYSFININDFIMEQTSNR